MAANGSIFDLARTTLASIKTWLGTDILVDSEPVHDATTDLAAQSWNNIVGGVGECAKRTRHGQLVKFSFRIENALASQTGIQLDAGPDAVRKTQLSCWAGSIVGLSAHVENARTAGTLTLQSRIAIFTNSLSLVIDASNPSSNRTISLPGNEPFTAQNLLDITYTTDAAWAAGATPSVWADLYVHYEEAV